MFPIRKVVVGMLAGTAGVLGTTGLAAHAEGPDDDATTTTTTSPTTFETSGDTSAVFTDRADSAPVFGPGEAPRPVTVINAAQHPVTSVWLVPQLPQLNDELHMDLPVGLPHKLKDLIDADIKRLSKDYAGGKDPKKITVWWKVTQVQGDGKFKVEVQHIQLVWSGGLFSGDITVTEYLPPGTRPEPFSIGVQVR